MKRDYKLYLQDMKDCITQIEEYTKGLSEEGFKKDKLVQDAVIRRFEIIGEASRNIPTTLKVKNKEVPWFEFAQFRNLVTHMYFEASLDKIWKTVKGRLPKLKESLNNITLI